MSVLRRLVDPNTRIGAAFERLILALIVISLIQFAFETLPEIEAHAPLLAWSERGIVVIFTAEYVIRIAASGPRYVLSFFGIVDLLAIAPFYISFGLVDLRSVRILRLLRLLRIFKLNRYGSAWRRLALAFVEIKDELVVYTGMVITLIYLAAVGIYYFEHEAQPEAFRSVFHAMWWAVSTLTTVGYGDVYPITVGGRVFTFVILFLGLSIVSVPSGLLASALMKQPAPESDEDPEAGETDGDSLRAAGAPRRQRTGGATTGEGDV